MERMFIKYKVINSTFTQNLHYIAYNIRAVITKNHAKASIIIIILSRTHSHFHCKSVLTSKHFSFQ